MRRLPCLLALALTVTPAPAAGIAPPYLVKDVNPHPSPASSAPRELVSLGDLVLFEAAAPAGAALWRSDGTVAGTWPLLAAGDTRPLAVTPERYFFLAHPAGIFNLARVWVTDGTPAGTFQLTDDLLSVPVEPGSAVWVPAQRALYFAAGGQSGAASAELWRTDGTPGGTFQVADIWPGETGSRPRELTRYDGHVCFVADDPERGTALWRSDGTPQGTVPVRAVAPRSLHVVDRRLVFLGTDPAHGTELWVSDGTTRGTRLLTELAKGDASPTFGDLAVHGRLLYFVAETWGKRQELWVTDGTAAGTRRLTGFASITPFTDPLPRSSLAGRLVFTADDGVHGRELWTTDGTAAGTRLVRDLCPGPCHGASAPLALHEGRLWFRGTNGVLGEELWSTDGRRTGTRLVKDVCPGSCSSWPQSLLPLGGRLLFLADDGVHSFEVWSTDGTRPGTVALTDTEAPVAGLDGAKVGAMLIFSFADPEHGREPWCTDGTPAGTFLLADLLDEDLGGSHPGELMALGGTALFFADDGEHGYELWQSDGTAAGTALVAELLPGELPAARPLAGSWTATPDWVVFHFDLFRERSMQRDRGIRIPPMPPPHPWTRSLWASNGAGGVLRRLTPDDVSSSGELSPPFGPAGSRVFFPAWDREHGDELWVTDGTPAGTRLLADLQPGQGSSVPHGFVLFQGKLWFFASAGSELGRLWTSDGTAAGTVPVGPELWQMSSPAVYDGRLWFTAFDEEHGTELWSTDGTDAGTVLTLETSPGAEHSYTGLFTDGSRLFFTLENPPRQELWVSDGTAAGTRRIFDRTRCPATLDSAFSGGLFFYAAAFECELVASDGTAAGTRLVRTPGGEPLDGVADLLVSGGRLLVVTFDGELWQTDGTGAGTTLIRKGLEPELLRAGSRVFFPAFDPETGWELWAIQE